MGRGRAPIDAENTERKSPCSSAREASAFSASRFGFAFAHPETDFRPRAIIRTENHPRIFHDDEDSPIGFVYSWFFIRGRLVPAVDHPQPAAVTQKPTLLDNRMGFSLSDVNYFFAVKLCNSLRIRSMTFPFTRPNVLTTMDLEMV